MQLNFHKFFKVYFFAKIVLFFVEKTEKCNLAEAEFRLFAH